MERLIILLCWEFLVFMLCYGYVASISNPGGKNTLWSYDNMLDLFENDQLGELQHEVSQRLGDGPTHEEWTEILSTLKDNNARPVSIWKPHFQFLFDGVGYATNPTGDIHLTKKTYANFQEQGKVLDALSVTFFDGTANESSPEEMVGATGTFASYTFTEVTPSTVSVEYISSSTMFLEEQKTYATFGSKVTGSRSNTFKIHNATFSMTKKFFSVEDTALGLTKRKGERNLVGISFGKDLPHFVNGTDAISDSKTGADVTARITGSLPSEGRGNYALYIVSKVMNELSAKNDFLEIAVHGYCDFPRSLNEDFLPEIFVD
ncbi:uncharacterized protein [Macrobrachium rosenbergii]|uniref:uncharacterized protein isoform X1 n=1 Tax=Macrobrachium rosenbergii TaxID=79674 RepID=UPI0034D3E09E